MSVATQCYYSFYEGYRINTHGLDTQRIFLHGPANRDNKKIRFIVFNRFPWIVSDLVDQIKKKKDSQENNLINKIATTICMFKSLIKLEKKIGGPCKEFAYKLKYSTASM